MRTSSDTPLSGVFRVVYFLATGIVSFLVVLTAVLAFYEPPEGERIEFGFPQGQEFEEEEAGFDEERDFRSEEDSRSNYNRNVSLILTAVSAGVFAAAILALGSRFNPLRAGLLLGGLVIFLTGIGFWADSSDQWIGFLMSAIVFAVLATGYLWLEEGLPLGPAREVRVHPGLSPGESPPFPPPEPPATPPVPPSDEEPPHPSI